MEDIKKIKSISLWIFIVPFVASNACLILVTQFHDLIPNKLDIIHPSFPYFDGGASISRTARVFPTYWIFKPSMFLTSYLLIRYWLWNKNVINHFESNAKHINKILFFGIGSAILLTIHSIFLGVKFDYDIYKLFRRIIMVLFIVFEIVAQAYLVFTLYTIKEKIQNYINYKLLIAKRILITTLIIVAIVSVPIISFEGNKAFKHALEWDYFLGVIFFYCLTFFMWKKN